MRSVTFAADAVVDLLNEKFVVCWNDHGDKDTEERAALPPQPAFTREELELYPEGGGGGNVRSYVCLPDGRIVHYVEGWFAPERFADEMRFALELTAENAAARHTAHARGHAEERKKILFPANLREPGRDPMFRRHSMLGLQARVHELAAGILLNEIVPVLQEVERRSQGREFK